MQKERELQQEHARTRDLRNESNERRTCILQCEKNVQTHDENIQLG
jgi:hypothetical protein